jgi:hypothetical protein
MSQPSSSSSVFRVVRVKRPPLGFSIHPFSVLANRLDPTEADDDDWRAQSSGETAFGTFKSNER